MSGYILAAVLGAVFPAWLHLVNRAWLEWREACNDLDECRRKAYGSDASTPGRPWAEESAEPGDPVAWLIERDREYIEGLTFAQREAFGIRPSLPWPENPSYWGELQQWIKRERKAVATLEQELKEAEQERRREAAEVIHRAGNVMTPTTQVWILGEPEPRTVPVPREANPKREAREELQALADQAYVEWLKKRRASGRPWA